MAATIHSIGALDSADNFEINGWAPLRGVEAQDFFSQAHAVTSVITGTIAEAGGIENVALNSDIMSGAIMAIETLLSLGMLVIRNKEKQRASRRAA